MRNNGDTTIGHVVFALFGNVQFEVIIPTTVVPITMSSLDITMGELDELAAQHGPAALGLVRLSTL